MITTSAICSEGRNCWRIARASRAAFLVDAAVYYQAFAEAAEKAERSIAILAWDINGLIRLRRRRPEAGRAQSLREFFLHLLDSKPQLHIYILNWDFPLIYAAERELLPIFDEPWHTHPRLHFVWDASHPVGACHHQKVVVIDDRLAFVGGLDLTDERWDMPCHKGQDRRRHGCRELDYKPFHDTMMLVEGRAAWDLGQLVRERWRRVGVTQTQGEAVWPLAPTATTDLWPQSVEPEIRDIDVAISRTEPAFADCPAVREIENLYRDSIAAAQRMIYIENQYFTGRIVVEAIAARLQEKEGPEIVVVLPQGTNSWMEEASLGVLRAETLRDLMARDPHGHLRVCYPQIPDLEEGDYLKVHSKVMVVDDRLLRIGSANICNRSMGMDTECDLAIEAHTDDDSRAVARFRNRLLAEHLGTTPEDIAERLRETGSLLATIDSLCGERCLVPFKGDVKLVWKSLGVHRLLFDPEQPFEADLLISREMRGRRKKIRALARLLRWGPFGVTYFLAFPLLGFWIMRKRIARSLWRLIARR
jgi:phospholipase D1/2